MVLVSATLRGGTTCLANRALLSSNGWKLDLIRSTDIFFGVLMKASSRFSNVIFDIVHVEPSVNCFLAVSTSLLHFAKPRA